MNYVFIIVGVIVGFLQYGLTKTALRYKKENKGAAGVVAVKAVLYAVLAAVLALWFAHMWLYCLAGVAVGIILTAVLAYFNKR